MDLASKHSTRSHKHKHMVSFTAHYSHGTRTRTRTHSTRGTKEPVNVFFPFHFLYTRHICSRKATRAHTDAELGRHITEDTLLFETVSRRQIINV